MNTLTKKILTVSILCVALMITLATAAFAADFALTSEIPAEISVKDAKTKEFSVSGTYDANTEISLQIKNTATNKVVLYQQATTAENGSFTISGTMSDAVEAGTYELRLGATNMAVAKDYYFDTIEVVNESEITVTVINGSANVLVNGVDKGEANSSASYEIGTVLTFTSAPADANQKFLYWQDAGNNTILSIEETIEVVVGSNASYRAVYSDLEEEIYVIFRSNNKILQAGTKDSITIPANPYLPGYVFNGWYDEDGKQTTATLDVYKNTIYTAGFKAENTDYNITIAGANEESGKYKYNQKVTVTAKGEEGKVFTHWTKDGITVSYNSEYSFYVSADAEVVANYADTAVAKQIVLVMAQPTMVADNTKIAFYAERNVPEEYTVIETGILLSQAESFDISTTGVIKAKANSKTNVGQYTIRKANVKSGDTWRAKAYLIYTDGTEIHTVYSEPVLKTVE